VFHLDALGPAGGAGRVDHVGEIRARTGDAGGRRPRAVDVRDGQHVRTRLVGDHQRQARVLDDRGDRRGRSGRVERHVRAARLQHAEQHRHEPRPAAQPHAHQVAACGPPIEERVRHRVGGLVQLGIGRPPIADDDRAAVRCPARLLLESLVYPVDNAQICPQPAELLLPQ
jgi:hypothetical protein